MRLLFSSLLAAAALSTPALAQISATAQPAKPAQSAEAAVSVPFHGNETCPISGKPVKQTVFAEQDQQRIYTCCAKCKKKVKDDFDGALAKAYPSDAVVAVKNTKCPISGKPTDDTDVNVSFQGHQINLCCEKCESRFEQNPRRYLALLKNPELKALNNKKCIVMTDEPIEPGSFFVYKNTLVDTCCADCAEDFAADPDSYLAKFRMKAADLEKPRDRKDDDKHDG
jgi:YHS domain-containing protein